MYAATAKGDGCLVSTRIVESKPEDCVQGRLAGNWINVVYILQQSVIEALPTEMFLLVVSISWRLLRDAACANG